VRSGVNTLPSTEAITPDEEAFLLGDGRKDEAPEARPPGPPLSGNPEVTSRD
jgi:hypothetical protein